LDFSAASFDDLVAVEDRLLDRQAECLRGRQVHHHLELVGLSIGGLPGSVPLSILST
jgi:hypothetical protein